MQIRATSSRCPPEHSTTQTRTGSGSLGRRAPATWWAMESCPVINRCSTASRPRDSARSTRLRLRSTLSDAQDRASGITASAISVESPPGSGLGATSARTGPWFPAVRSRGSSSAAHASVSREYEPAALAVSSRAARAASPAASWPGHRAFPATAWSTVPSPSRIPAQPSARWASLRSSSGDPPLRASRYIRSTSSARSRARTCPPLLPETGVQSTGPAVRFDTRRGPHSAI